MRSFISNAVAALANFIEIDNTLMLGERNGALNVLHARVESEREQTEALERYARAWAIQPREGHLSDELSGSKAEIARATRLSRRKAERERQESRRNARQAKEMRLAY